MDQLREHIQKLREDFSRDALSEEDVAESPSQQFGTWIQQAAETRVPEWQAMHLSTVSDQGRPSSRVVYLREFGEDCYYFYTNYNSRKVQELNLNPYAALTFFWPQLERQVRIEVVAAKAASEKSDAYFNLRPFESRLGAWASAQSHTIASRSELETKVEELKKQFNPENIRRPDFWGGIELKAYYYEFWQGRRNRLHDRICYINENNNWKITRLAP
jgi:pyridoxamine 5'-phosphate oxidase